MALWFFLLFILSAQLGSSSRVAACWRNEFICSEDRLKEHVFCCTESTDKCTYGKAGTDSPVTDISKHFKLVINAEPCRSHSKKKNKCQMDFVSKYCDRYLGWYMPFDIITKGKLTDGDRKILNEGEQNWERAYMNLIGMAALPPTNPGWVSSAARMVMRIAGSDWTQENLLFLADFVGLKLDADKIDAGKIDTADYEKRAGDMYDKYWPSGAIYEINIGSGKADSRGIRHLLKSKFDAMIFENYDVWQGANAHIFVFVQNLYQLQRNSVISEKDVYKEWAKSHPKFAEALVSYSKTKPSPITPESDFNPQKPRKKVEHFDGHIITRQKSFKMARSEYQNNYEWNDAQYEDLDQEQVHMSQSAMNAAWDPLMVLLVGLTFCLCFMFGVLVNAMCCVGGCVIGRWGTQYMERWEKGNVSENV